MPICGFRTTCAVQNPQIGSFSPPPFFIASLSYCPLPAPNLTFNKSVCEPRDTVRVTLSPGL